MPEDTATETKKDAWCINGQWKDRVCVCDPGKATHFDYTLLTQKYCNFDDEAVALLRVSYPPRHYIYLSFMSLTALVTVAAFMVFATAIASIVRKILIKKKIEAARQELNSFEDDRLMRDDTTELNVTFWTPPTEFRCINQQKHEGGTEAKVVATYNPQNQGELPLKPGMTVTNVEQLDRGWCKGTVGEKTGFFPAAFVEIIS